MRQRVCFLLFLIFSVPLRAAPVTDQRQLVSLPPMMREHMLHNMRDHLETLQTIIQSLARGEFDVAAEVAEARLGMSSLQSHGAEHMAPLMPEGMRNIGTAMHHAASRFAVTARNAEVEGGRAAALEALSEVMEQCVACHASYRVR